MSNQKEDKRPPEPREAVVANVLSIFGGLENVSEICGVSKSAVCQWRKGVPYRHQQTLLSYAREKRIKFTAEDFFQVPAANARVEKVSSAAQGMKRVHVIS